MEAEPLLRPQPVADGARILKTRIDFEDATASLPLLQTVSEHFLRPEEGNAVIRNCATVVSRWREYAQRRLAPGSEIERMASAFEHDDLSFGLNL